MEGIENIKTRLLSLGENYDTIKPFMQDYLLQIERLIEEKLTEQELAITTLRETSISVSSIAKELGCSRTTLYNHDQLLKRYIESVAQDFDNNNPLNDCEALKKTISKLQYEIGLMYDRDIDIEVLRLEVKTLQELLKEKTKEIERLRSRVGELSSENHILMVKKKSNETKGVVTPLKNKT